MKKALLIDGHSILNRAFYGVPDLTNAEGLHTNAIYGFLNILFKCMEEEKPDYLTVAFDVSAPTFRHKMYDAYKGTRKPMAEELRQQVPVMKEVLKAMGVVTIEQPGLEADDLLGTLSETFSAKGIDVTIISGDRDLLQLAKENVKISIPKTKQGKTETESYYPKDVQNRYLVTPSEFIDLKALMGDPSDNIPGVPSIGEKTATKIITEYHSIENAFAHVDEIKPPRASKALAEHYDMAQLSKKLATIEVHAEVPYHFEEAKVGNLYTREAYAFFQKLQFRNLLKRFDEKDSADDSIVANFHKITQRTEIERIIQKAERAERIGLALAKDTQNVLPLFVGQAQLSGIGLCFDSQEVYYLCADKEVQITWILQQITALIGNGKTYVAADVKALLKELDAPENGRGFDAIIAAYLLNPLKNDYDWWAIAQEHLGLMPGQQLDEEKRVCYEAYTAYAAAPVLRNKLEETGMWTLFSTIEMPLVYALDRMEKTGIQVEGHELAQYGKRLGVRIEELEEQIYQEAGETFNINSPKQLGVILFEKMDLPHGKKTKTGYSTSASILEKLAPDHPFVNRILEYRQLAKLKSTYADGLANFIGMDGRIHGTFNQTITATGRISSTEPNLQNIPVRMELGHLIRKVFVPREGYVFVDADYSQVELRILAHCAEDEKLIEAYRQARDIHQLTASQVFHVPFDQVTSVQRRNAKAVNFGIVYGISSFGLSQGLSISRKEAGAYIDQYFATYPGIKKFLDHSVQMAKEKGYVTTLFGRRRPVPELSSSNFMQRSFGERVAMNSPIQGTAADIMKIAMIHVDQKLRDRKLESKIVLQVHDELLVEAKAKEVQIVSQILKEEMEQAADLLVPLDVEVQTGHNWYDAK